MRTGTRVFGLPLFLAILLLLISCDDDSGPVGTGLDDGPGEQDDLTNLVGPELTTIAPAAVVASRVFDVTGAPGCCELPGGPYARFGARFEVSSTTTVTLTSADGTLGCNSPPEDPDNGMSLTFDQGELTWTSTVPVGAVMVSNGSQSRVYVYSGRSWGDSGLTPPPDAATGNPTATTSVAFCYDYALAVTTEPETRLASEVQWELRQQTQPPHWDLLPGDRATSEVTVDLEKMGQIDTPPLVHGTVTITNSSPLSANITSATNIISVGLVTPLVFPVTLPYALGPGESVVATYDRELPDATKRLNLVTVNTIGAVRGGSARADVEFGDRTMEHETVHVRTADGTIHGPFVESTSIRYLKSFDCAMLEGDRERVIGQDATILETGGLAPSSTMLRCWEPTFEIAVETSYSRRWSWELRAALAVESLVVAPGMVETVTGTVRAIPAPGPGEDYRAMGTAALSNSHPDRNLELTQLDLLIDGQALPLDPIDGSSVAPGAATRVSIHAELPDGGRASVQIRASYQNREFAPDGSSTPLGEHEVVTALDLVFDQPAAEIDRCAIVRDADQSELGLACAEQNLVEFPLVLSVGPFDPCARTIFEGSAWLVTQDTGVEIQAPYSITIEVPCEEDACTRGHGYWKSHTAAHPRHPDPTWELLADGPQTPLFESGMTWHEALSGPIRHNMYKRLARAWVTARLNAMAGANSSVIAEALADAETMLRENAPGTLSRAERWKCIRLTWRLQAFNKGWIGPGNCGD